MLTLLVFLSLSNAATPERINQILEVRCARCHDDYTGAHNIEKNFADVSEIEELGASYISKVIERVENGEMPKSDPEKSAMGDGERREVIKFFTGLLNKGKKKELVTEFEAQDLVHRFLKTKRNCGNYRFLSLHNLYNSARDEKEFNTYLLGVAKALNSLSYSDEFVRIKLLGDKRAVMAFKLSDLESGLNEESWERLIQAYPYAVDMELQGCGQKPITELLVRADWFTFVATQGDFYHEFLQITPPLTQFERGANGIGVIDFALANFGTFQRLLGFDYGILKANHQVTRTYVENSRISTSDINRMMDRWPVFGDGYLWTSYDFENARRDLQHSIRHNPEGPDYLDSNGNFNSKVSHFKHDGGETIYSLPNGLQGYLLTNSKGFIIDKGPTAIVSDDNPKTHVRTSEIINGVSCMSCHDTGMFSFISSPPPRGVDANLWKVLDPKQHQDYIKKIRDGDEKKFLRAMARLRNSLDLTDDDLLKGEPVTRVFNHFTSKISLAEVEAEIGFDREEIRKYLRDRPDLLETLELGGMDRFSTYIPDVFKPVAQSLLGPVRKTTASLNLPWNNTDLVAQDEQAGCRPAGAPLREVSRDLFDRFYDAIAAGDVAQVCQILRQGFDVDFVAKGMSTPLQMAIKHDQIVVAKVLLASGAKVDLTDEHGNTALFYTAIHLGSQKGVAFLLGAGANLEARNNGGLTPFIFASHYGNVVIIQALANQGAQVGPIDAKGRTALHHAAQEGHANAVQLLLNLTLNPEFRNSLNESPFESALYKGHETIVKILAKLPGGVDDRTLLDAIIYQNYTAVEILLRLRFRTVKDRDENNNTALHIAAEMGNEAIADLLVQYGARLTVRNDYGETPLFVAVRADNVEAARFLIKVGGSLQNVNDDEETLLYHAIENGNLEMVKLLVVSGTLRGDIRRGIKHAEKENEQAIARYLRRHL